MKKNWSRKTTTGTRSLPKVLNFNTKINSVEEIRHFSLNRIRLLIFFCRKDFSLKDSSFVKKNDAEIWSHRDMSPLKVWLSNSILPIVRIQLVFSFRSKWKLRRENFLFLFRSKLVDRALLNFFFDELNLLEHLENLRTFYFLATGRFGIGFSSEISRILLSEDDARSIYRLNSIRQILYSALDQTGRLSHFIDILQLFPAENIPETLTLLDPTLFDYFHLNYSIQWPLNIFIDQESFEKYRKIFRFLLRVLIVKQVLNEIWLMLKNCEFSCFLSYLRAENES